MNANDTVPAASRQAEFDLRRLLAAHAYFFLQPLPSQYHAKTSFLAVRHPCKAAAGKSPLRRSNQPVGGFLCGLRVGFAVS